jgi:hypothetical protein
VSLRDNGKTTFPNPATTLKVLSILSYPLFTHGTTHALGPPMMDVALSLLALISGGLTLELFSSARPSVGLPRPAGIHLKTTAVEGLDELEIGNPS